MWPGEPIPIFHSSIRQARPPRKRNTCEEDQLPCGSLVCPPPQPSLFSLFVTGIAREGEEFGKLRTVPDSRSGPSVSSNPSYPSITGVGGDYKFPWIPTLVSACCIVSSTGNACLPAELRQAQAPKQKDRTSTDNCYLKSWPFWFEWVGSGDSVNATILVTSWSSPAGLPQAVVFLQTRHGFQLSCRIFQRLGAMQPYWPDSHGISGFVGGSKKGRPQRTQCDHLLYPI